MVQSQSAILVTGATGFIGGRLAECLVEGGESVRLLVRDPDKLTPLLRSACDVIVGDLQDEDALASSVQNIDIVFHCAANVSTWDRWESYHSANVIGVNNLLNAVTNINPGLLRFVHLSTVDVYGFPIDPCDEECKLTGGGFGYGETKIIGESLVREYSHNTGLPYTIIRPANIIGPNSQFISRIGRELKSGVMLKVNGGHTNAGILYIDNLIDYMIWASKSEIAHGECYNARDNYDISWATFLDRFRSGIAGKGVVVSVPFSTAKVISRGFELFHCFFSPNREPLLHRLLVNFFGRTCGHSANKIRNHSGIKGKIRFDEAMARSCQWFLDSGRK